MGDRGKRFSGIHSSRRATNWGMSGKDISFAYDPETKEPSLRLDDLEAILGRPNFYTQPAEPEVVAETQGSDAGINTAAPVESSVFDPLSKAEMIEVAAQIIVANAGHSPS